MPPEAVPPGTPSRTRETPREPWPKPQPSRGSQSRSSSGRGPNSDREAPSAEAGGCAIRRSLRFLGSLRPESHCGPNHSPRFRGGPLRLRRGGASLSACWPSSRSTIPKDPRSVCRPIRRLQFPGGAGVTVRPVSRLSGLTSLTVSRQSDLTSPSVSRRSGLAAAGSFPPEVAGLSRRFPAVWGPSPSCPVDVRGKVEHPREAHKLKP